MYDLHCHIIPNVDDGPKNFSQSLELLRAAVANGITHMVATPHIHPGRYFNTPGSINVAFQSFLKDLESHDIPMRLAVAAEVRVSDEVMIFVSQKQLPMLGFWQGDPVVLLEMPHSHIPPGMEKFLRWLQSLNIRPMIAHPERNKDIIRDIREIDPLVKAGCLFQITAGALVGQFGVPAKVRGEELLKRGLITVMATDTHHPVRRPPNLSAGREAAEKLLGADRAWDLVMTNPMQIVGKRFADVGSRMAV